MMTLPALTTRAGILLFSLLSAALLGGAVLLPLWSGSKPVTAVVSVPAEEVVRGAVQELTSVNFIPTVRSEGTVAACDEVNLTAQLAGQVLSVSPVFEEGAFLSAGTVIAELDAADFRGAVLAAEAQLARARSAFALEETRARQAKLNWEELGYRDAPGELVLRVPRSMKRVPPWMPLRRNWPGLAVTWSARISVRRLIAACAPGNSWPAKA